MIKRSFYMKFERVDETIKIQCEWREPEVLLVAICEVDDVIKDYELQETEFIAMFQNQFCIWSRDICDN